MKILMLATYFPPDTAIAAVRPYMFAKYLALKGHNVTILRSGEFLAKLDDSLNIEEYGVRVISYLGENSPAEKYKRGEIEREDVSAPQSRISFLPIQIREPIAYAYHKVMRPVEYRKEMKNTYKILETLKKAIDNLSEEQFDIVWATFGRIENIFACEYAGEVFSCPWIIDLRDRIANEWDRIVRSMQKN